MKEQEFRFQHGKNYRCRPALYESLVANSYLLDIDRTRLFAYDIKSLSFIKFVEVIEKDDQFCAKIRIINDKYVGVFGMYSFSVVSIDKLQVMEKVQISNMIELVQAKNQYISILTSDDSGEGKLVYCFKINDEGKLEKKYNPVEVSVEEYEDFSEEKLDLAIIQSIIKEPKIYLYWKGTNHLIEIDPELKIQQKCTKKRNLLFITDINYEQYCQIIGEKILIWDKMTNKEVGALTNQNEKFKKVLVKSGQVNEFYSLSDKGVKKWRLKDNEKPLFYAESDKYELQNIYVDSYGQVIGMNLQKRIILIWKSQTEVIVHNFQNEAIKRILKLNEKQVCIFLQATVSKEVDNEVQVQKYHKMEIYDFEKQIDIARKAVQKLEYKIDIQSAIVDNERNVYFILNQDAENQVKRHIFRWSPFVEEKKKQSKKRQIIGGNSYDAIKLYPFDRIITFKKAKHEEMYDLFGKATQSKSTVNLLDLNAKNIGNYDLPNDVVHIQLSSNNQLYALSKDNFTIFEINSNSKNRLEKIHELQVGFSYVCPYESYIFTKKDTSIRIYDKEFDLTLKEDQEEETDENRLLPISKHRFLLANKNELSLWDLEREEKTSLKTSGYNPNMVELMNSRYILLADKWIQCLDFQSLTK